MYSKFLQNYKFILFPILGIGILFSLYNLLYFDKILPHVFVASVDVSGITQERANDRLRERFNVFYEEGITLLLEGSKEIIDPTNIDMEIPSDILSGEAWLLGRRGAWHEKLKARIAAPFSMRIISGNIYVDEQKLESEIAILAEAYDVPTEDVRYNITGTEVDILYDTKPGKFLDPEKTKNIILSHIANLDVSPIVITLDVSRPRANPDFGDDAKAQAETIIKSPITLSYKNRKFITEEDTIASWIVSYYKNDRLVPSLNEKLISEYVVGLADKIDTAPQNLQVLVEEGKVVDFLAPKQGRALLQDDTIGLIIDALLSRISENETVKELSLPVIVKKPSGEGSAADLGITELIGTATTPFTGSPKNRILNIKNGTKFLTGVLIPPGEEFSTVGSLGRIDNTTGYLPELVIKGNETIPEFGGGLCQVSTTLFRSVLNAGLPVVERRNHSYRVPYYERDGEGNFIGPGLDATIYSPKPDFKFKNDTESYILIQGFVEGSKVTFELYGTGDGRKASIDGPHTLEETPPGDPIYTETDTLPLGEIKKIDTAHPGGVAVATYTVEYPDGTVKEQEFKSYYRKWPAKYLVGTATSTSL